MMELTLSTGARVKTRPMPTHVFQQFVGREEAQRDPMPEVPVIRNEMKSAAGGTEVITRTIEEGDPGYAEWEAEMDAWTERNREATQEANLRWIALSLDYGITEWCLSGSDEWAFEPPDDWEFPAALARGGLEPSDNRRLDYILLEVIPVPSDYVDVLEAIRAAFNPITEEEVESQMAGFRPAGEPEEAGGSGDRPVEVSRRDGRGVRLGLVSRLLGKGDAG
jgi:hypothetical protein